MKNITLIILLLLPLFTTAQTRKEARKQQALEYQQKLEAQRTFIAGTPDEVGYHMQKAGTLLVAGSVANLIGVGVIALGASQDQGDNFSIIGGGVAVVGIVLQIVGFTHLKKAGDVMRKNKKIAFTGKGLSFAIR